MKQNLLKTLLLSSIVSISLCGCNQNINDSSNSHVDGETSSSVEESTPSESLSQSSEASNEVSSSEEEVVIDPNVTIELSKYIYIEGEDAFPYFTRFDVYSPALGKDKSYLNKAFEVKMPEVCSNGKAYITVTCGTIVTSVEIYYFKDVATAIANTQIDIPSDASSYFNEEKYIKNGTLTFECSLTNGVVMKYINDFRASKANEHSNNITWNSKHVELWYETDTYKLQEAHYDASKKTIEHFVSGEDNFYNISYEPPVHDAANISSIYNYEVITDGNGKIAYFAPIDYTGGITPASETGYWSYYKDPATNPAFTFAEDYDPETNPNAFQKVLPENGMWLVGYNNTPNTDAAPIDTLWKSISGTDDKVSAAVASGSIKLVMDDSSIENSLMNAIVSRSGTKQVIINNTVNQYEKYAYLYSESLKSGNADLLAMRDEVYDALILTLLPEVTREEILSSYYKALFEEKLATWEKAIISSN